MKAHGSNPILLEKILKPVEAFSLSRFLDSQGMPVYLAESPSRWAVGEIPFLEVASELYLADPDFLEECLRLIKRFRAGLPGVRGAVWQCGPCGEVHEPQFGACWNCGGARP